MTSAILHIDDLAFAYPGAPPLWRGWSACIGAGVTLLHGDTGSGKTSLLRILAGTLPATGGLSLAGLGLDQDADAYRQAVFYVDPATEAWHQMTGEACTAALQAPDSGFDAARWQALVAAFGLAEHIAKPMFMLSTGSRRKVWLAAALASGRQLVLLDEPTGGLDGPSVRALWSAVEGFAKGPGRALVIASSEAITRVPLAATLALPLRD